MSVEQLITHPKFTLSSASLVSGQTAHEPDVVVDHTGTGWVVWSERGRDGDRICLRDSDASSETMVLSGDPRIAMQPTIELLGEGRMLVVWIAHSEGTWSLESCLVTDGRPGLPETICTSDEGLFHPRILEDEQGHCRLVCERISGQESDLVHLQFDGVEWIEKPIPTANGSCFRPCLCKRPDDGVWLSYDCYRDGFYSVFLQRIDQPSEPIAVASDGFQNIQSDLAADADGNLLIAWSSNANDREDPWWLTKYVQLLRFDGQDFSEPMGPMPDRDLYNEDSWQGWEFPAVTVDAQGRVWLFGQASHTLYAQYYDDDGWSERFDIAPRRWGSWKPRVRTAGKGPIYVAAMGLGGAQLQKLTAKGEGYRESGSGDWVARSRHLAPSPSPRTAHLEPRSSDRAPRTENLELFFGDLHAHSIYGDATGDVDEFYHRYRDAYGYDFATLTEHDFLDGMELSQSELKMMWAHADGMTVSGKFVAMYGYEWTSPALADHAGTSGVVGEGHRHILYPDQSGPLVSYGEESANTGAKLLNRLSGQRALVIQHHTAWSGTDWDAYDPKLSRLIEICSTHGRFEFPENKPIGYRRDNVHPGKFVVDGLNRGLKFGFVGGSDSHGLRWHATEMEGRSNVVPAGTRVGWKEDAYRTGMTAILAPKLTREALFDALYNRSCYATSGVPIELDFRVDGNVMGSEIEVDRRPRISASVRGTAELDRVQLVRSGKAFFSRTFGDSVHAHDSHLEMEDDIIQPGESHYYYFRVIQRDGNMAWSSPIWVNWR